MHRSAEGSPLPKSSGLTADGSSLRGTDTIAAISTPPGEGAIAIVRLSGPHAILVADQIFRGKEKPSAFASRSQHLGELVDGDDTVDQVVMTIHRAPASYTGEDVVEINCHGGTLISARVLELCLRSGARAARPGEFTERAFRNGKMDLTQAEAVIDLIRAKTDLALRSAREQLEGKLGEKITSLRDALIALSAHLEASIDFSEEGIAPDEGEKLDARLQAILSQISQLLATADQGRILREGVRVVLYGPTNAGKSSLLNRLLGYDRTIVSETHGTTRDTVEEVINLQGVPIRLLDTAGLRESTDPVECQGITRTERSLENADLRLYVGDRNAPRPADFAVRSNNGAEIVVLNKADLPEHRDWNEVDALRISCVTGEGLGQLKQELLAQITHGNLRPENMVAINRRHRVCLQRALASCERAQTGLGQALAPEYLAVDIVEALRAIGEIIGEVETEQILDSVFGQFCIGK